MLPHTDKCKLGICQAQQKELKELLIVDFRDPSEGLLKNGLNLENMIFRGYILSIIKTN